jgi:hypothetical protein
MSPQAVPRRREMKKTVIELLDILFFTLLLGVTVALAAQHIAFLALMVGLLIVWSIRDRRADKWEDREI